MNTHTAPKAHLFLIGVLAAALLLVPGCAITIPINLAEGAAGEELADLNQRTHEASAQVHLYEGELVRVTGLKISGDSARWMERGETTETIVLLRDVRTVVVQNGRGAALAAAVSGVAAGVIVGHVVEQISPTPPDGGFITVPVKGIVGGLFAGVVAGSLIREHGFRATYVFHGSPPQDGPGAGVWPHSETTNGVTCGICRNGLNGFAAAVVQ
jgi:uncharacterized membrane protein YeaQ/YmgE (transglycosylase-associated protein family)